MGGGCWGWVGVVGVGWGSLGLGGSFWGWVGVASGGGCFLVNFDGLVVNFFFAVEKVVVVGEFSREFTAVVSFGGVG